MTASRPDHHSTPINRPFSRRKLIKGIALSSLGIAVPAWLSGCARDPITGERSFMLLSREDEIAIDRQQSPHQISADYGRSPDAALNQYIAELGQGVAEVSHRPDMPYSFEVVNANYINAYAFPGGTIRLTRGIMLEMSDEAELVALLGHEVVHVTGRHSARNMSRGMLTQAAVGTVAAGAGEGLLGSVVGTVGQISAGALLANYSRDNERDADRVGMDYAALAGHNPEGMIGLAGMLNSLSSRKPNAIEIMFSSHPGSDERLSNARSQAASYPRSQRERSLHRERYMEMTSGLRLLRPAIEAMQEGERQLAQGDAAAAEASLQRALSAAPEDYTGLMLMGKLKLSTEQEREALSYFQEAHAVFPEEGQAIQFQGLAHLGLSEYRPALAQFESYETVLPGNPGTDFLAGYCHENLNERTQAGERYRAFLRQVQQGPQADYARARLQEWGMA